MLSFTNKLMKNSRGFSLLEVLLGVTVFMIGMLGVTALNISSLKSNTFSGNMSEATFIAADKLEELLAMDYALIQDGADGDGTDEDLLPAGVPYFGDGIDDDGGNFGLDDIGADADESETGIGKNGIYDVYWNVAEDEPMPNTKTINVIVRWQIKDVWRQINMQLVRVGDLGS
jgi:type IV pilus assembly protein PilV